MKLAVFDVDGTLCRSTRIDADCFVRAFREVLPELELDTDWASYRHVTDSGIVLEIFRRAGRGLPAPAELRAVRARFRKLLAAEIGDELEPVPGAIGALDALARSHAWHVALATGAWAESARIKLRAARIPIDGLPLGTADDAVSRVEILRSALARTRTAASAERVVLIGDRAWDADTAVALGLPLVGIACEGSRRELQAAGTSDVLDDYGDLEGFLRALDEATVPRRPAPPRQP